jgi:UDP-glucose 4-epimerase
VNRTQESPPRRRGLVTGGAGFIGSHLVDRLLGDGWEVTAFDNLSTGRRDFLSHAHRHDRFRLVEGDVFEDRGALADAMAGMEVVFHLAAHADVRFGPDDPRRDLEQNAIGTFNVLEAMRGANVRDVVFASTGAVYGEPAVHPTPENAPFPVQTSFYGASKLAGEGLVAAFCEAYGMRGWIFRFVSILGERYSHGHVFDFAKKLRGDPSTLEVLGDGTQRKSYLHVGDCVDAMLLALDRAEGRLNLFNLGNDEYCSVNDSVAWISAELGVRPKVSYTGGSRGWVGDSPFVFLDCSRMRSLGWRPTVTVRDAVLGTARWLTANEWILETR